MKKKDDVYQEGLNKLVHHGKVCPHCNCQLTLTPDITTTGAGAIRRYRECSCCGADFEIHYHFSHVKETTSFRNVPDKLSWNDSPMFMSNDMLVLPIVTVGQFSYMLDFRSDHPIVPGPRAGILGRLFTAEARLLSAVQPDYLDELLLEKIEDQFEKLVDPDVHSNVEVRRIEMGLFYTITEFMGAEYRTRLYVINRSPSTSINGHLVMSHFHEGETFAKAEKVMLHLWKELNKDA